jgi:CheY-like chemotaxis protein
MPHSTESLRCRILVIDDSPEMLELDRIILESAGYQVFTASSGEEALRLIDDLDQIQLILVDYHLPEMNGSDFILKLEKFHPKILKNVPVIIHSGMDSLEIGKATGIIPKVTGIQIFLDQIKHYLDLSRKNFSNY